MEKHWKILFVGLGSIGQRHMRNLKTLLGNQVEFLAYRVRRLQTTFSDTMQVRDGVQLEEEYGIKVYSNYDEALCQNPDVVFITNITAKHMECALKAAEKGLHIFMEKPLSDSLEGVEMLKVLQQEKRLHIFMGYQNRYHPCIKKLREVLNQEVLGNIVSVKSSYCERLITMHTYEDYSTTYMARKDMGGGPLLNLQIHDLDILQWLFGMPDKVNAILEKHSALNISVEDHAFIQYKVPYKNGEVSVFSESDFLAYPPVHRFVVTGDKARVEIDMNAARFVLYNGDGSINEETYADFRRNDMFIEELKDFLDCIEKDTEEKIPLEEGIKGLTIAMMAKEQ